MLACMCLVPTAINDTCAQVTFWHRLEHLLVFATFPRVQIWDLGSQSRPLGSGGCFFVVYVIALHFFCSRKLSENQISAANFYLKHEQKHMSYVYQNTRNPPKKIQVTPSSSLPSWVPGIPSPVTMAGALFEWSCLEDHPIAKGVDPAIYN